MSDDRIVILSGGPLCVATLEAMIHERTGERVEVCLVADDGLIHDDVLVIPDAREDQRRVIEALSRREDRRMILRADNEALGHISPFHPREPRVKDWKQRDKQRPRRRR